jgi:hypothetical protein
MVVAGPTPFMMLDDGASHGQRDTMFFFDQLD